MSLGFFCLWIWTPSIVEYEFATNFITVCRQFGFFSEISSRIDVWTGEWKRASFYNQINYNFETSAVDWKSSENDRSTVIFFFDLIRNRLTILLWLAGEIFSSNAQFWDFSFFSYSIILLWWPILFLVFCDRIFSNFEHRLLSQHAHTKICILDTLIFNDKPKTAIFSMVLLLYSASVSMRDCFVPISLRNV